jgi:hypothetical protein
MAKKKPASVPVALLLPLIYEATCGASGSVIRGQQLTQAQAEARRQAGQDVVVCGAQLSANRILAGTIERNANGSAKRCSPHAKAGPRATAFSAGPKTSGGAYLL